MTLRPTPSGYIDTDRYSSALRELMIDRAGRAISLTNFGRSAQAADLSRPPNCDGFGRVHRFEEEAFDDWPPNPLPIRPRVLRGLVSPMAASLTAQVFQSSGCNWRCWYCYVPFTDLTARHGTLVTVDQMIDWTLAEHADSHVVDLSGGQPDLTPEWPVWFLKGLDARGVDHVYVWSDDNLSTDYLWRYLSPADIDLLGHTTLRPRMLHQGLRCRVVRL